MSGLFRSEDMTYVRILMNDDSAYDTVRELGKFKMLHVVDVSNNTQNIEGIGRAREAGQCEKSETR